MSLGPVPDYLAKRYPHPRDEHISFEEGPHIYTIHGERGTYTSVTTWNHSHFSKFYSSVALKAVLRNPKHKNDPTYKYYQKSDYQ